MLCFIIIIRWLKERYRVGKKQKSWRSQIYIKITRSNDVGSRNHPLKYFSLNFHIRQEINNLISRLEFIPQWAFIHFVLASMQCKICNRFFFILLRPRWSINLKLLQVCQYVHGGLHKVCTLPATFFASKTNSVMFLCLILFKAALQLTK